ncbi:MAG: hypothetical protein ACRENE_24685 [Polyangiaceae bacterium]
MITCWPSLYRPAAGRVTSDRAIVQRARRPYVYARKDLVPRWAGAEFCDGYRDLAHWTCSSWIVLDFDGGASLRQIERAFSDWTGFAHTTWSSTPEAPRWRVAARLDRLVHDRDDFARIWRAGAAHAEAYGLAPDYAARDPSRAWALPALREGAVYQHVELCGALLDVELALSRFPKHEPVPEPHRLACADSYIGRLDRASKYLAKMPPAISGSGGHAATFRAATVLVRGFEIEPRDALRLLVEQYNPRCAPEWSIRELEHKIKSASQRARVPFGWLSGRCLRRST